MTNENEMLRALFHIKKMIFSEIGKSFMEDGMTSVEVMVLYRIKHGSDNQKISEMAKEMGIPASTFTGIIDRLEEKDFVERVRNKEDRRIVTVRVKDKMNQAMDDHNPAAQFIQSVLADTEPGWVEDFTQKLQYLEALIEKKMVK